MSIEILNKKIIETFDLFNNKDIKYVLLRGYPPIQVFNNLKDIDVFIDVIDIEKAQTLLTSIGWEKVTPNIGRFPHMFFRYFATDSRQDYVLLDIESDIFYGDELRHFKLVPDFFETTKLESNIRIASAECNILLFILRIAYDKKHLSNDSKDRLEKMMACYLNNSGKESMFAEYISRYESLINKMIESNSDKVTSSTIRMIKIVCKRDNLLEYSFKRHIYRAIERYLNLIIYKLRKLNDLFFKE